MNELLYRSRIIDLVESSSGIKSVDLVVKLMGQFSPTEFNHFDFNHALEYLVSTNQIVEIEYVLKNEDYRLKSIYFPKGTKFEMKNRLQ